MKLKLTALVLFTFAFISAQEIKENPFTFKWDNGFKLESADKEFKLKFGGRIMVDYAFFNQDNDLDAVYGKLETKNGTEFRRTRFFMSGILYGNIEFKLQVDFSGGKTTLKDAYIGLKNIPAIGNLRLGHVKEPFRFDALTSSKYITFMERALPIDFSQERNNGLVVFNDFLDKKLSLQAGFFRNSNTTGNNIEANNGSSFTARITGLPLSKKEKEQLLHLGLGFSNRKINPKTYIIASRPEAHLSSVKYISTGTIENIDNIKLTNFETVFVKGALTFQGEYLFANIKTNTITDNYTFSSYYGQVSYFLTGESKKYKNSYSGFDRVKPKNNFDGKGNGSGAWELALRYSQSDLNSKDILGGEQADVTLGLNWYLNSATRIMINHIWANIKNVGKANILQARFQIDF